MVRHKETYEENDDDITSLHVVVKFIRDNVLMNEKEFETLKLLDITFYDYQEKFRFSFFKKDVYHDVLVVLSTSYGNKISLAMIDGSYDLIKASYIYDYDLNDITNSDDIASEYGRYKKEKAKKGHIR